jgi:predicted TIM-barrel fold metal-dependent hydrolase
MDYQLISADDHLDIRFFPKDLFTSRVPAELKAHVPHVVATDNERPFGVPMLPLLFEDRVMWASDYPHPASTWPNSKEVIARQLDGVVGPETRQKLLADNARRLYGL